MSELLPKAFAALGQDPSEREISLVVDTLMATEAAAVLKMAAEDHDAFQALAALACAAGSSGFVALDVATYASSGSHGIRPGGVGAWEGP